MTDDLGALHFALAHETDPVRRAGLAARLRRAAEAAPAAPTDDPVKPASIRSGVLSRSVPGPENSRPAPETDGSRGWRRVAALNVGDVLGL